MSSHSTQPSPQSHPGPQAAEAHAYVQVLHDLITMGSDLARLVHHQATAQPQPSQPPTHLFGHPTPVPSPESLISLTTAFDRIARAVRRSILMARTLADPIQPAADPAHYRTAARRRILREVEDAIQRAANNHPHPNAERPDTLTADTLTAELHDRLDAPDLDDDLATRPIPDIITEICRDLGLAARPGTDPWKRRTPADIQHLCARAAAATPQPAAGPAPTSTTPQPPNPGQPPPINLHPLPRTPAPPVNRDDPAEAIATVLRHPGFRTRPRPPPNP